MTESLKNMASSVDWGKLMSRSDARNAIIGTALGGLLLGGASLARDKDPEESKSAPVGDALLGGLMGGVAGYSIPKGLSLFVDSGGMAPDDDQLSSGYISAMGKGALSGAGLAMGAHVPGLYRAFVEESNRPNATLRNVLLGRGMLRRFVRQPMYVPDPKEGRWGKLKALVANRVNGSKYKPRADIMLPFRTLRAGTKTQMALRAGKYGAVGAALAALSHALVGPSSRDNFKN